MLKYLLRCYPIMCHDNGNNLLLHPSLQFLHPIPHFKIFFYDIETKRFRIFQIIKQKKEVKEEETFMKIPNAETKS